MPEPISPKQIKLIHIAKHQLGLSDDAYRLLLMERYPGCFTGSCKELSYEEAHDLIEHFKALGFGIKKREGRRRLPRNMAALVTHRQKMLIEQLQGSVRWYVHDGAERFSQKIIGKARPATTREAAKLIEALKGLKASQDKKEAHG